MDFAKCAAKLLLKEGSWRCIPRKMEAAQLAVFYCEVLQQLLSEFQIVRYFLELFADAAIEKVIAVFLQVESPFSDFIVDARRFW